MPGCDNQVAIRSQIKSGEFKGLKVCPFCKVKHEDKKEVVKKTPAKKALKKKISKSALKRKEERKDLPLFFSEAISEMQSHPFCDNCGVRLSPIHSINNVAHILSKRKYKSVMSNKNNRVFLCTEKDHPQFNKSCHSEFDNKVLNRPNMKVFGKALENYKLMRDDVEEVGTEKLIFENYYV